MNNKSKMMKWGIPEDTHPEASSRQVQIFREMTPEERLRITFQLCEQHRSLIQAGIRHRHPDYNDEKTHLAFLRLIWGDDLFRKVYPGVYIET